MTRTNKVSAVSGRNLQVLTGVMSPNPTVAIVVITKYIEIKYNLGLSRSELVKELPLAPWLDSNKNYAWIQLFVSSDSIAFIPMKIQMQAVTWMNTVISARMFSNILVFEELNTSLSFSMTKFRVFFLDSVFWKMVLTSLMRRGTFSSRLYLKFSNSNNRSRGITVMRSMMNHFIK